MVVIITVVYKIDKTPHYLLHTVYLQWPCDVNKLCVCVYVVMTTSRLACYFLPASLTWICVTRYRISLHSDVQGKKNTSKLSLLSNTVPVVVIYGDSSVLYSGLVLFILVIFYCNIFGFFSNNAVAWVVWWGDSTVHYSAVQYTEWVQWYVLQ